MEPFLCWEHITLAIRFRRLGAMAGEGRELLRGLQTPIAYSR